ncbi:MAG: peptide-methionine (S)-S-oxide reductase MsrA [Leptolyngbyaceae bacterium]|nr:peptide-methionine (S)-S-oxide reductase MsrA [Leptolyngbyaceae bacterium]
MSPWSLGWWLKRGAIALLTLILSGLIVLGMGWFTPVYASSPDMAQATFAGGCFWCMEHPFDELPGVQATTAGYTGGTVENPTYEQVSSGTTGHVESVQIDYDPSLISYGELLDVYWHNIDPVDGGGQFCDRGNQYRPIIFYHNETQQQLAESSKQFLEQSDQLGQPLATEILPAAIFYPAEDYHQNYYQTHALRYRFYRYACGRDQRLQKVWGEVGDQSPAE